MHSPLGASAPKVLDTTGRVTEEAKTEAHEPEPEDSSTEPSEAAEPRAPWLTRERLNAVRRALPVLWLLAAALTWWRVGPQLAFLVAASGVLLLVITLMWSSVQSLTGGASIGFEEALSMGAPSKVEEEKRAVLRALKDLEYERSVGKISPEDYAELSAQYRADAKRLIQRLDETLGPARKEVERAIERRLSRAGVALPQAKPSEAAAAEEPAEATEAPDGSEAAGAPVKVATTQAAANEELQPPPPAREPAEEEP